MEELEAINMFKCLADKSRLHILKCLLKEPSYVELLSNKLNLAPSTISFHLKKMEEAKLVNSKKEQYYMVYSINKDILKQSMLDILKTESVEQDIQDEREIAYRKKVIENFFKYNKLVSIPVQRKKRLIILEEISKAFELDKDYTEKEVNIKIADFNDDFCTLRREMITEKLFTRDNGIYRRIK